MDVVPGSLSCLLSVYILRDVNGDLLVRFEVLKAVVINSSLL
jgi:hypothetical protein